MNKKVEELEKKVSMLETMITENRRIITELINCFNKILGRKEIDAEEIKKLDQQWLNQK